MEGVCMTFAHVILTDEPARRLSVEALVFSFTSVGKDLCVHQQCLQLCSRARVSMRRRI